MLINPIKQKINRLKLGGKPRVLDIFAGCGGLSLGFQKAGFEIVGSVECDHLAAQSHAVNFCKNISPELWKLHANARDITVTEPEQLISELHLGSDVTNAIDVIIGGPPCQAFARVGRSKLREVADHPEAFMQDPRANLYLRYLHYVKALRPLALLMENVPDALNYGGHNIAEEMCQVLTKSGYRCGYTLLNAVYYGVPQMRERMFLIAYAHELEAQVTFPNPTHWIELPRGYNGSRQVALKNLSINKQKILSKQMDLFNIDLSSYISPPPPHPGLLKAISASEAIGDLPPITLHLEGKLKRGAKRFTTTTPYSNTLKASDYAQKLRKWEGFEANEGVKDHIIRVLSPRDFDIFRRMSPGEQYPEAYQHAINILNEKLEKLKISESKMEYDTVELNTLKKQIVPPYDPSKFPNKWRKMEADKPARTLMAHLGKDSYSHIHYDSTQARTISVREAARLQSFPDQFIFVGTMNPAFKQIGNAVPPLLAAAIANQMFSQIQRAIICQESLPLKDLLTQT
ncbi:DNA cytosine methyltransferase [Nodularia sp. NIES-3585]|uniref:DNA cytosine methyltransferase n=1 Tax=Nodularia sp. NIES-3585 TaxID=1973477 RepID=UPI000B5CD35D|nr:DNA cytosine methyltransferase [Nodularia sp. NIES-3585]GAX35437.1 C-5 cytosine-specific DNA methylase [Nodularia sp. NIES-3585]